MMEEDKSSISKADSYEKIGEYWDLNDLGEIWNKTKEVEFNLCLQEISQEATEK